MTYHAARLWRAIPALGAAFLPTGDGDWLDNQLYALVNVSV